MQCSLENSLYFFSAGYYWVRNHDVSIMEIVSKSVEEMQKDLSKIWKTIRAWSPPTVTCSFYSLVTIKITL